MMKQVVKLPGPISQALGSALSNLLEEVSKEIGADLAQTYRNWKRKNLQEVLELAGKELDKTPLLLSADQQVSPGFIFSFIESASNAESPELRQLWAKLLVAAAQGRVDENHKTFVDALNSFTPAMAVTFLAVCSQFSEVGRAVVVGLAPDQIDAATALAEYDNEKIVSALVGLKRVGAIRNVDRRFDLNARQSVRVSLRNVERSLIEISDALDHLSMASEIPIEKSVERHLVNDRAVVILAVLPTEFGVQLRALLGLSAI